MKIARLEISNIGGVKAFELDAKGEHVVIGGKNGAGKSTVLRAIASALGGSKERGPEPLRKGEKDGQVVVDLGELVVKWRVTESGKNYLSVETADGAVLKSPQAKLRKLFGDRTFDPLGFYGMSPSDQTKTLANLFGVDFDEFDARRAEVYSERTTVNRLAKEYLAQAAGIDVPDDKQLPSEPIDVSAVSEELREAQREHDRARSYRNSIAELEADEVESGRAVTESAKNGTARVEEERRLADDEIADLERRLALAKERRRVKAAEKAREAGIFEAEQKLATIRDRIKKGRDAISQLESRLVDIEPLEQKLANAERVNRAIEARQRRDEVKSLAEERKKESERLTAQIAAIDSEKAKVIADADVPIDGLSIEDGSVTWHGKRLESLSSSEQLRVSVALGVATHPDIAVMLIDRWNDLDDDGRAIVRQMADEAGVQIWTTVVGTKDEDINVTIVDGEKS